MGVSIACADRLPRQGLADAVDHGAAWLVLGLACLVPPLLAGLVESAAARSDRRGGLLLGALGAAAAALAGWCWVLLQVAFLAGELRAAVEAASEASRRGGPQRFGAYLTRGGACLMLGEWGLAAQSIAAGRALSDSDLTRSLQAVAHFEAGERDAAWALLEGRGGEAVLEVAARYRCEEDGLAAALELAAQAAERAPGEAWPWRVQARLHLAAGDARAGLVALERAADLDLDLEQQRLYRALLTALEGQDLAAGREVLALAAPSTSSPALLSLGALGGGDEALRRKAQDEDHDALEARWLLGELEEDALLEGARSEVDRLAARFYLALRADLRGNHAVARAEYARALEIRQRHHLAYAWAQGRLAVLDRAQP
ncbi:MAG: hypothetical protein AB7N76_35910 [Planctomycetota bacterium]